MMDHVSGGWTRRNGGHVCTRADPVLIDNGIHVEPGSRLAPLAADAARELDVSRPDKGTLRVDGLEVGVL